MCNYYKFKIFGVKTFNSNEFVFTMKQMIIQENHKSDQVLAIESKQTLFKNSCEIFFEMVFTIFLKSILEVVNSFYL